MGDILVKDPAAALNKQYEKSTELMCGSCKAILIEVEKRVGKRKRTEDVIYDAMDKICDQDVFRTYEFIPPEMKRGCQMLLQDYFADEDLTELLYKNKPGTEGY